MHFNLNLDQISDSGDLNSETEICRLYYDQKEIFNFRFVASGLKKIQIDDLGATVPPSILASNSLLNTITSPVK